jgi:hypothetical protein
VLPKRNSGVKKFGVLAALTGDVGEFLVLDIKEFAEKAACSADLAGFV